MHSYAFRESARKPRESIEALNMDSRSGQYEGFQTPFFPINLVPDFGYEALRRGPLLWPVIHGVQSSPTPSSSTSRSLTPIGSESVTSSPSPPPVVESVECTSQNNAKTS